MGSAIGGASYVDQVLIEFARQASVQHAFAFDRGISVAGLTFPPGGDEPR